MRFAIAVAMFAWAAQISGPAAADLYRWIEPETGSIKFSSYPPPWYGDPAKQRGAPKVQVIPERSRAPAFAPRPDGEADPAPAPAAKPPARPDPSAMKERPADGR
jgi:hypothetical protein